MRLIGETLEGAVQKPSHAHRGASLPWGAGGAGCSPSDLPCAWHRHLKSHCKAGKSSELGNRRPGENQRRSSWNDTPVPESRVVSVRVCDLGQARAPGAVGVCVVLCSPTRGVPQSCVARALCCSRWSGDFLGMLALASVWRQASVSRLWGGGGDLRPQWHLGVCACCQRPWPVGPGSGESWYTRPCHSKKSNSKSNGEAGKELSIQHSRPGRRDQCPQACLRALTCFRLKRGGVRAGSSSPCHCGRWVSIWAGSARSWEGIATCGARLLVRQLLLPGGQPRPAG